MAISRTKNRVKVEPLLGSAKNCGITHISSKFKITRLTQIFEIIFSLILVQRGNDREFHKIFYFRSY